jgi:thiol-disulfide isomerase/thioredoxin
MPPPQSLKALVLEKAAKPAPAVAFFDLQGGRHALADFKGRYVLLNLWATWCAPCVSELPALAKLKLQVPALKVLAVDVYAKDKPPAVDSFLKSHNAAALGTLTDKEITLGRAFGAYGLPVTVLVDPQGKVIARAEGPAEWSAPDAIAYFKTLTGG